MKDKIISIFYKAIEYYMNLRKKRISVERVIGEKADVVTGGDIEIGDLIIEKLMEDTENKIVI